ncbi:potassium/proton antiporter [Nocardioides limicola]|uniref:potassium/proton antiporter n=1 Tax=Nocardioides limicola TaxID=2803368 RepID=UPI00193B7FF9
MFVLVGATVTLLAILAVRISFSAGLPSLLLYLLMGVALGEAGLGISFSDADLAQALGFGALVIILAEGGLSTDWDRVRPGMRMGVALATLGTAASVTVVAVAAHYILGMPWELAVLLAAITAPTDAAAVFSVLRVVPLPQRLTGTLEAESGLNDAPTIVLVTLITSGAAIEHGFGGTAAIIVFQLLGGALLGYGVGLGGAMLMRRVALPSSGLYPLAIFTLTLLGYAVASVAWTSGFAAVYVAALVLGNTALPHRAATRSFVEGLAWLAQIGLFVMLGLLLSPSRLTWEVVGIALLAGLILTLVARPVSVLVCAAVQPMPWRDLGFLSWAGLRGAVPIVLATIPLAAGADDAQRLFDIVFVMVVVFTLVTGPTLPVAARLLKVSRRAEPRGFDLEAAPLGRVDAEVLQVTIAPSSKLHGVEIRELRLPVGAVIALIVRDGKTRVPDPHAVLKRGDDLLVVTPRAVREATERRLRAVSQRGRLARWLE